MHRCLTISVEVYKIFTLKRIVIKNKYGTQSEIIITFVIQYNNVQLLK